MPASAWPGPFAWRNWRARAASAPWTLTTAIATGCWKPCVRVPFPATGSAWSRKPSSWKARKKADVRRSAADRLAADSLGGRCFLRTLDGPFGCGPFFPPEPDQQDQGENCQGRHRNGKDQPQRIAWNGIRLQL